MSLLGTTSDPLRCQSCKIGVGSNVLYIGNADFRNSYSPTQAYTNGLHGKVYVCDRCVWEAFASYFGDLVPEGEFRPLFPDP